LEQLPSRPFIKKPHFYKPLTKFKINNSKIHYTDLLTYTALRSYRNEGSRKCFPSLETLAKRMNVCKTFVIESIRRLENAKFISVWRSPEMKVVNHYYFMEPTYFDRIPYEFLYIKDLTLHEKSMLLALREMTDVMSPFDIYGTIKELAFTLCMTYKTLHKQLTSLIAKGYIKQLGKAHYRFGKIQWLYMDGLPREKVKSDPEPSVFVLT